MAHILRSISFKIFGVSVLLLIMMVGTAVWSARTTEQVHRQLRTLEQALFPLSGALSKLDSVVQTQKATADLLHYTTNEQSAALCLDTAKSQAAAASNLLSRAEAYRATGAKIAVLERNKLMFARLQPMIEELGHQERRLSQMTIAACDRNATTVQMQQAQAQAEEVLRLASGISSEITGFVETGAGIVARNQQIAMQATLLMIGAAGLVGVMLAWLVSRGLTRPIVRLQAGARAVGSGQLDQAYVPVTTRDEIGDVTRAFNAMIEDLREKDRIKDTFGQYVDPRVVANLLGSAAHSSVGEKQIATLFFSDVVKFSEIAERLAPSTLVDLMNAYFSAMSEPIRNRSGIIDKYIGDAIMAFWVPPFVDASRQAELACQAALEQYALLDAFRATVPDLIGLRRDVPLIDFRAGLATGEVVVGSVGSQTARSFTVMGDTVNQASRLEAVNKVYRTRLLIDQTTFDLAEAAIEARWIDEIRVVGRIEPLRIYGLAAMAGELPAATRELFEAYENALGHYRAGDWDRAEAGFAEALRIEPHDGPSMILLGRIAGLRDAAPANWSGVWDMTSK
jgi:adenylate cyclase